jgi:signal transduction histidine kinase
VNLLTNAFRHNPPGTRVRVVASETVAGATPDTSDPVRAALAAAGAGGAAEIEICVSDDGPGFPAQLAMAPFDSARRHRSHTAGAGLGLSIARGIITAHGGRIELAPLSTGTTFQITLPVEAAAAPEPGGEPQDPIDAAELAGLAGLAGAAAAAGHARTTVRILGDA